tara:strand:+ start:91 stop:222 length:132 start_codon:yes stop_codon:yes gene_type:complete
MLAVFYLTARYGSAFAMGRAQGCAPFSNVSVELPTSKAKAQVR